MRYSNFSICINLSLIVACNFASKSTDNEPSHLQPVDSMTAVQCRELKTHSDPLFEEIFCVKSSSVLIDSVRKSVFPVLDSLFISEDIISIRETYYPSTNELIYKVESIKIKMELTYEKEQGRWRIELFQGDWMTRNDFISVKKEQEKVLKTHVLFVSTYFSTIPSENESIESITIAAYSSD